MVINASWRGKFVKEGTNRARFHVFTNSWVIQVRFHGPLKFQKGQSKRGLRSRHEELSLQGGPRSSWSRKCTFTSSHSPVKWQERIGPPRPGWLSGSLGRPTKIFSLWEISNMQRVERTTSPEYVCAHYQLKQSSVGLFRCSENTPLTPNPTGGLFKDTDSWARD